MTERPFRRFAVGQCCPGYCPGAPLQRVQIEVLSFSPARHALRFRLLGQGFSGSGSAHIQLGSCSEYVIICGFRFFARY